MIKLTENAKSADDLTHAQYCDICDELKGSMSWDKFIKMIGSTKNKAQWYEWYKGDRNLLWEMKNDLRKAVGLPLLPEPVAQVLERMVSPDALIETYVTEGKGSYVGIYKKQPTLERFAAGATKRHRTRVGVMRPSHVPLRYDEQRRKLGKTWLEVVEAGLVSIERGDVDGKAGKGERLK